MNKKIYLFIAIIALASIGVASTGEWRPPPLVWEGGEAEAVVSQLLTFICVPACIIISVSSAIAALLLIFAGARYIAADDPGTRTELRRFMTGVIVGLVIVVLAMPIINFIMSGILPDVKCDCIGSIDNINSVFCNLIGVLSTIGPWLCALVVIYGGLRYLTSADDPGARKSAKTTLIAAFVGLIIIMLAIPLVNMVLGDALRQVDCPLLDGPIVDQIVTILENFLCIIALIAPPICALVVTYGGLRYITSAEDPGARDAAKTIIISALIGMVLVILAIPLVNMALTASFTDVTFNCTQGQATAEITQIMCNFMCFLSYIAPAVCALVVIYGGLRYLVSGDDPGARRTARTIIISAFIGLILVLLSMPIVNLVLTNLFGQVSCDCTESDSVRQVIAILCKFICLFASVAPAISALVLIFGGLRYVTSAEDPAARNAAKTMIIGSIVGLILVMISLSLVNLFMSGIGEGVDCGCLNIEDPATQISNVLCTLACTLQMITPAIAVIVILYGGLKYLTTGDDPGARATARGIVIHAIIGLVFVMLAIQIVNIVILNLMPTFRCDCAQVFPAMYNQLGYPNVILRVQGVGSDEICAKCCGVGKTECHYKDPSGNYGHVSGVEIQECSKGSASYSVKGKRTGEQEADVTQQPPFNSKCVYCPDGTAPGECKGDYMCVYNENLAEPKLEMKMRSAECAAKAEPACSSTADAAAKGPTFVYDTVIKDCVNKCAAGQNCCQATDQNGRSGCIGKDTGNQVKLFKCFDGHLTVYKCASDKCTSEETQLCLGDCKDAYSCTGGTSPDSGDIDLANPAVE